MGPIQIENGMVIRIPVRVIDARDRSNIRCVAGTKTVLLEASFLSGEAEVVSGPPPAPTDQMTELLKTVAVLALKVTELETGRS